MSNFKAWKNWAEIHQIGIQAIKFDYQNPSCQNFTSKLITFDYPFPSILSLQKTFHIQISHEAFKQRFVSSFSIYLAS